MGYDTTEATLERIGVQDMRQMYRLVEPCRAKVSIVGAVTRAQADAMVTTLLSRLPAAAVGALRAACRPWPRCRRWPSHRSRKSRLRRPRRMC